MPFLWAIIAGILTYICTSNPLQPIMITNILLGLIVGVLFERRNSQS